MPTGYRTGHLLAVIDATHDMTTYDYADQGDLPDVTDPRGHVTQLRYNGIYGLGDLKSVTNPRGPVTQLLAYDRYGNAVLSQDAAGNQTRATFDARSRLIEQRTFGRDNTSGLQVAHAHVEYAYDALDRQVRMTTYDDLNPENNQFQL